MSLIRSTSNPERLYVFGDSSEDGIPHYNFCFPDWASTKSWHRIPCRDVEDVINRYYREGLDEPIRSGEFMIKECMTTGPDFLKIQLYHFDEYIGALWVVTWEHIVHNFRWQEEMEYRRIPSIRLWPWYWESNIYEFFWKLFHRSDDK